MVKLRVLIIFLKYKFGYHKNIDITVDYIIQILVNNFHIILSFTSTNKLKQQC